VVLFVVKLKRFAWFLEQLRKVLRILSLEQFCLRSVVRMLPSEELISQIKMRKKFSLDSAVARHKKSHDSDQSLSCHHENTVIHEHSESSENCQEHKNIKLSPQDTTHNARARSISLDSAGLVLPRKLVNPCMQSAVVREIHREIKWTKKT
jgi:hypothetical protein